MSKYLKISLLSLSAIAVAGVAYAGSTNGFDVDCLMQSLEAGVDLCIHRD